jgi:CCR4-NOT transcription complex subunit 1
MIQLGPEMTSDPDIMAALLARFGMSESTPPQDDQVVEIVSQLSRLASEGPVPTDVGTLVHTLALLVSFY